MHRVGEGGEDGLLFQGEADEGDEVGEAPGLGAAPDLAGSSDGKGVPEAVLGPGGVGVAELLFQVLEHGLGEALLERAAVEDLQGVDFGLVGNEIIAEGLDETGGFGLGGGIEALLNNLVRRVDVDGLFGFPFQLLQRLAQRGAVEGGAGFGDEFLPSGFVYLGRDFFG